MGMSINANNIHGLNNTYTRADTKSKPADALNNAKNPISPATHSEVVDKTDSVGAASENKTDNKNSTDKKELSKSSFALFKSTKSVVFEYNKKTGDSVVKFMDAKGNVVAQVPPEQYLKMKELMGGSDNLNIQNVSADTKDLKDTGLLLNKKA